MRDSFVADCVRKVRSVLTPDLLHPSYRDNPKAHCYAASEAVYHLLTDQGRDVQVWRLRIDETTVHWYLRAEGSWIDPTADQFDRLPEYETGRRCGFLTKKPSARSAEILRRIAS